MEITKTLKRMNFKKSKTQAGRPIRSFYLIKAENCKDLGQPSAIGWDQCNWIGQKSARRERQDPVTANMVQQHSRGGEDHSWRFPWLLCVTGWARNVTQVCLSPRFSMLSSIIAYSFFSKGRTFTGHKII